MCPTTFQPDFQLSSLLQSLVFDHSFKTGRKARLFGSVPYGYGTSYHLPLRLTENPFVNKMFKFIVELFPSLGLNSCLINYYPDSKSIMPDHSDNETYIEPFTFIVTVSLGSSRNMIFKERNSGTQLLSVNLKYGDILLFSKESQCRYTHGIPSSANNLSGSDSFLPRISATFRRLRCV